MMTILNRRTVMNNGASDRLGSKVPGAGSGVALRIEPSPGP